MKKRERGVDPSYPTRLGVIGAKGVGGVQGGIETYCSNFYRHLTAGMFEVTFFVSRRGRYESNVGAHRIVHIHTPRVLWLESPLASLLAVIIAWILGIRTLHMHGINSCLGLPIARVLRMKTVVRYMGPEYTTTKWGPAGRTVLWLCERFLARFADQVVCLNSFLADQLREATGRTARVSIVPNGVNGSSEWEQASDSRVLDLVRSGEPYVLTVGRIVPPKNFHVLVEAFLVSNFAEQAKLVIVGEADFPGDYSRMIKRLTESRGNILMTGALFGPDLSALYRHCTLFVLPSMHEGMSFSLLEACAAGAKIIASDIPANAMVCGPFARLVEVNSVAALAHAMSDEWNKPQSLDASERQALFSSSHQWDKICSQMEPLLVSPSWPHARSLALHSQQVAVGDL